MMSLAIGQVSEKAALVYTCNNEKRWACIRYSKNMGLTCAVQLLHAQKDDERQVMPVPAKDRSCGRAKHGLIQWHAKNI